MLTHATCAMKAAKGGDALDILASWISYIDKKCVVVSRTIRPATSPLRAARPVPLRAKVGPPKMARESQLSILLQDIANDILYLGTLFGASRKKLTERKIFLQNSITFESLDTLCSLRLRMLSVKLKFRACFYRCRGSRCA